LSADMTMVAGAVEQRVFGFPFFPARLPAVLADVAAARFEELWELHPAEFYEIRQPGTGKTISSAALASYERPYIVSV